MSSSLAKDNFAYIIELRVLGWEIILDYLNEPNVITRVLVREKQEGQSQRRRRPQKQRIK